MENCYDTLMRLIDLKKKKKEPNSYERHEFASAWAALVKEEGFSERAEIFLYKGYTYCGAEPFRDYMEGKEKHIEALQELYSGNLYGDNCVSTTSVLFHLLSLSLNNLEEEIEVIVSLLQQIPRTLENRAGHLYGKADQVLKKYFFDKLETGAKFPDIEELLNNGLSHFSLKEFTDVVDTVAEKMNLSKYPNKCKHNVQNVNRWLHPVPESPESSEEKTLTVQSSAGEKPKKQDKKQMSEELLNLEKKFAEIEKIRSELQRKVDEDGQKISNLENAIKFERNELSVKSARISELLAKNNELESKVFLLEKEKEKFKEELGQRSEMIDMLRRDRAKQSDENMKRLASKLRTYYTDYMDAENLKMSIELGENMRDQLGEVLRIISSSGISCK